MTHTLVARDQGCDRTRQFRVTWQLQRDGSDWTVAGHCRDAAGPQACDVVSDTRVHLRLDPSASDVAWARALTRRAVHRDAVICLVNVERTSRGLKALKRDRDLAQAAAATPATWWPTTTSSTRARTATPWRPHPPGRLRQAG